MDTTGRFKCEVSGEAPLFQTASKEEILPVVGKSCNTTSSEKIHRNTSEALSEEKHFVSSFIHSYIHPYTTLAQHNPVRALSMRGWWLFHTHSLNCTHFFFTLQSYIFRILLVSKAPLKSVKRRTKVSGSPS